MTSLTQHVTRHKGFTLAEVVMVIGLFSVALLAIVFMYSSFISVFGLGQATKDTSTAARDILIEIETVTLPASTILASHVFPSGTFTTDTDTLVLEIPSIDASGTAINGTFDYAAIYISSGIAYRLLAADLASVRRSGTKQLSGSDTTLSLTYNNGDLSLATAVTAVVTVLQETPDASINNVLESTFYLRNHN